MRHVTFLWRSDAELDGVHLQLNRVTDKSNAAQGLMTRLSGSDVWSLTLSLPASYRGSYTFSEIPLGTLADCIPLLGTRWSPLENRLDPFNPSPPLYGRGTRQASILALDEAPAQPEWDGTGPRQSGRLVEDRRVVAGQERRVRLYIPAVGNSTPLGLLVITDAEVWLDRMRLPGAIDTAITSSRIRPFAILGIDNLDIPDRIAILGGRTGLVDDIAHHLVPRIRADHPELTWDGRERTVISGQSLGGVTALTAALTAPHVFGTVLAHSPSMWWRPDARRKPADLSERDTSWVTEHVLSAPPADVRVRLGVGSLEGPMVSHVERLHDGLVMAGVDSQLTVYSGGHDLAWWRGALLDDLCEL
ncbi:alpha/beta hydrolase-fold protein [Propionibacterium australiense]|uniref:alpha/beta hydrolase-fold protein n=1 Tax=Propionibacterium australiense TaxID=119981 RepID=UPI0014768B97|nr:alpha/beta hydrolase-fold protein [Propionibacterium australiense]